MVYYMMHKYVEIEDLQGVKYCFLKQYKVKLSASKNKRTQDALKR